MVKCLVPSLDLLNHVGCLEPKHLIWYLMLSVIVCNGLILFLSKEKSILIVLLELSLFTDPPAVSCEFNWYLCPVCVSVMLWEQYNQLILNYIALHIIYNFVCLLLYFRQILPNINRTLSIEDSFPNDTWKKRTR